MKIGPKDNLAFSLIVCIVCVDLRYIFPHDRCGNMNFARRDSCNRCHEARPGDAGGELLAKYLRGSIFDLKV